MLTENFKLEEFVGPQIFDKYGYASRWFLDEVLISAMDEIREKLGMPIFVNDWYRGGHLKERGFRLPETKTGSK